MRRTFSVGVSVVALVAALVVATPATATLAGRNGRLVFSRNGNIFTIDPDGSDQVRLTTAGSDHQPTWSPDGRSIAFVRADAATTALWVMNADGTGQVRVGPFAEGCGIQPPSWSPDGSSIAYSELIDESHRAIWRVAADGSSRTRLTTFEHSNSLGGWSPDGGSIVFTSDRDGDHDVWVMGADGSNSRKLTQNTVMDLDPSYSPDGARIVFYRASKARRSTAIWTIAADGTAERQLTSVRGFDLRPEWSPDGRWIAFRRDTMSRTGTVIRVYRIDPSGTGLRSLTGTRWLALDFTWSPDSTRLLYQATDRAIDDVVGIEMVAADGTALGTVLTGRVGSPDWQALR